VSVQTSNPERSHKLLEFVASSAKSLMYSQFQSSKGDMPASIVKSVTHNYKFQARIFTTHGPQKSLSGLHLSGRPSQPIHTKLLTVRPQQPACATFFTQIHVITSETLNMGSKKKCTQEAYLRQDRIHTMTNSKYMYIYILYAHIGTSRVSTESDCWSSPLQLNNLLADVNTSSVRRSLSSWLKHWWHGS
jgi:hypothetical protein